jgi:hypothetical protein
VKKKREWDDWAVKKKWDDSAEKDDRKTAGDWVKIDWSFDFDFGFERLQNRYNLTIQPKERKRKRRF